MELCLKITQKWRAGSKKWATKDVEGGKESRKRKVDTTSVQYVHVRKRNETHYFVQLWLLI